MGKGADELNAVLERRLIADVEAALKRRPPIEGKLAGALRALAPYSASLRACVAATVETLVRRSSFDRELYAGAIRAVVDSGEKRAVPLVRAALSADEAGGLPALSAACFLKDASLSAPLARAASSRHAHLAFAAEVARVARGESTGSHLTSVAPKIKESHRIALCVDLLLPLVRGPKLAPSVAPGIGVLRDAERHLGRWLVLAEVASRAGDTAPLSEAVAKSKVGPSSSRAAWSLVAWALDPSQGHPDTRPTAEIVARLSDRPSADRDTTFLFRLAEARAPCARAMLEGLVKALPLVDEVSVRAAKCLVVGYGRADMVAAIEQTAVAGKREDLRGIAAAALWDVGAREGALTVANELAASKVLAAQVWSAFVLRASDSDGVSGDLLSEPRFRRVQSGWVE
jgi:hypothetical protein